MKMLTRIALLFLVTLCIGRPAFAQSVALADDPRPGLIGVGAYIGREFDAPDHSLLLGADVRLRLSRASVEIDPRFTFRPIEDGSVKQIDINFLHNFQLANPGRFRPFFGAGLGINTVSVDDVDSNTDLGVNLISGARFAMRPGAAYEPFVQMQYTIMNDRLNAFTVVAGATFSFR
jgi:hypothetical protein